MKIELLVGHAQETYRKTATLQVACQGPEFYLGHRWLPNFKSSIVEARQAVVPESLWKRILYLAHHPPISRHPGQCRMYDTLHKTYHWPIIAGDVVETVAQCAICAKKTEVSTDKRDFYSCSLQKGLRNSMQWNVSGYCQNLSREISMRISLRAATPSSQELY